MLDDVDHDLLRKVCHSHHSLNHLLPPEHIFINLRARYLSTLHCRIKSHLLQQHVLLFGHWLTGFCVWLWFYFKCCFPFVCAFVTWIKITYLLTYIGFSLCLLFRAMTTTAVNSWTEGSRFCGERAPSCFSNFVKTNKPYWHVSLGLHTGWPKKSKPPPIFQKNRIKDCQRDQIFS